MHPVTIVFGGKWEADKKKKISKGIGQLAG